VAEVLAGIEARNPELNAFIEVTAARALAEARAVDASRAAGRDPGLLAGVPFAVKNLYDVRGLPTLAGSKINRDLPPAGADATLVQRLNAAGAVLVGTLNMDEYAYGFSTENTHYGATRNPHDLTRISGGSSGGSAAAVAAGQVPITLGSDTNGSIRVPSSCRNFGRSPPTAACRAPAASVQPRRPSGTVLPFGR
jgi:Asp-tRNA(Asn)/Glu-tRNA(Gln) amidotransferase A subunit family amidase